MINQNDTLQTKCRQNKPHSSQESKIDITKQNEVKQTIQVGPT